METGLPEECVLGQAGEAGVLPAGRWLREGAARRSRPGPALVRRGGDGAAWLRRSSFPASLQAEGKDGQESEVSAPEEGPWPAAASAAGESEDVVRGWTVLSAERRASV